MTWAQRLKRVFGIDIETCPACGREMRIILWIEEPDVFEKILVHLVLKGGRSYPAAVVLGATAARDVGRDWITPYDDLVRAAPSAAGPCRRLAGAQENARQRKGGCTGSGSKLLR